MFNMNAINNKSALFYLISDVVFIKHILLILTSEQSLMWLEDVYISQRAGIQKRHVSHFRFRLELCKLLYRNVAIWCMVFLTCSNRYVFLWHITTENEHKNLLYVNLWGKGWICKWKRGELQTFQSSIVKYIPPDLVFHVFVWPWCTEEFNIASVDTYLTHKSQWKTITSTVWWSLFAWGDAASATNTIKTIKHTGERHSCD